MISKKKYIYTIDDDCFLWLMAAQFEIRQKNLKAARQILGNAIGMAPKGKIFKKCIEIKLYLGNQPALDMSEVLWKEIRDNMCRFEQKELVMEEERRQLHYLRELLFTDQLAVVQHQAGPQL